VEVLPFTEVVDPLLLIPEATPLPTLIPAMDVLLRVPPTLCLPLPTFLQPTKDGRRDSGLAWEWEACWDPCGIDPELLIIRRVIAQLLEELMVEVTEVG